MTDSILSIVAANLSATATIYWVCLIVGGGLLLISAFAGGHGHGDIGTDFHPHTDFGSTDAAHAHVDHAHPGSLAGWFSIRFLIFFMAVFGLVGVSLTHLANVSSSVVLLSSTVSGFLVGQGVHQLLRKLNRTSGDSTTQTQDYINKIGRVTIRIEPPRKGEVAILVGRGERFIPAISKRTDRSFKVGDQVAVTAYTAGIAEVVAREEYEFLADKES
ncbi:MAG: hypothetical protein AABZ47_02105 [Planctomycetota bacterium]